MPENKSAVAGTVFRASGFISLGDPTQVEFDSRPRSSRFRAQPPAVEPSIPLADSAVAVAEVAPAPEIESEIGIDARLGSDIPAIPAPEPMQEVVTTLETPPSIDTASAITRAPVPVSQFQVAQAASLGVPFQNDIASEPVAADEDLLAKRDLEDADRVADDELELDAAPSFFSPRAILRQRGVVLLLVAAASLTLLFAFTEVVALVNQIHGLPLLLQPLAYAVVGLLGALVAGTAGRLVWLYFRLKTTPRVSVKALSTLRERAVIRRQALEGLSVAERSLQDFLVRYPLETKPEQARLVKIGFTRGEVLKLIEARENLLNSPRGSAVGWMDQFNRQFVQDLDTVARRRIKMYTRLVGFKTAAVPNGFLDTLIVLINAYLLVGDLCVIYNVRAGGWGTAGIMAHIFVNAFAAGRLDEWSSSAADQAAAAITHHGTGLMANAVKGVTKVAARAADGYINALLISRLGNATVYHLRPLVEPPSQG